MEKAIRGNDIATVGALAERDTLELHSLTMTGDSGMVIMTEDTIRVMSKVKELRSSGVQAYFSMQTGPSVFVNTADKDERTVQRAVERIGYAAYLSGVGREASIV